jgi:broad specificity phosphatase PhoE
MTSLTPYRRTPRRPIGRGGRVGLRLIWGLLLLALLAALLTAPAAALDTVYLVRHAEKAASWPTDRDLDAFQPLSPAGAARAEALAARLKPAGIVHVYTSRTTRTLQTGVPLALGTNVPITAEDASTKPDEMAAFLTRLREKHAADKAILIVGHSNTIPELLIRLGAKTECFQRLGITGQPGSLLIEGYEGVWTVDLKKPGCEGMGRSTLSSGP